MRRALNEVAVLAVAVMLVAGCTLPTDDEAQVLTGPEVDNVMNPTTTSTTSAVATRDRELFFFDDDDLLTPSVVAVPHDADIAAILNMLAPTDEQSKLRTAVPDGFLVSTTELSPSGVLTVVLADDTLLVQVGGDQLPQAVGQIVVTATELDDFDVREVRFALGDPPQPRQVPTGDGVNTSEPVDRCDYRQFLPEPCT